MPLDLLADEVTHSLVEVIEGSLGRSLGFATPYFDQPLVVALRQTDQDLFYFLAYLSHGFNLLYSKYIGQL